MYIAANMKLLDTLLIGAVLFLQACRSSPGQAITPRLEDDRLNETSGIAASNAHPGIYYVHNDSGDTSRFFAISPDGKLKGVFYYNADKTVPLGVKDCEDIAVSTGPEAGASYVYLGDIGDNSAVRKYITIYRIKEPALPAASAALNVTAEPLTLQYPDGARDAETLMADPVDKLLYIVSKREDTVRIYTTPLNFTAGDTLVLNKRASLYFEGSGEAKWIVAGDIAQSGQQVLLKSYTKVYYWKRASNTEPIWQTLLRSSTVLPYTLELQGEAIGFTSDGTGYYTVGEGAHAQVYYYKIP